MPVLPCSMNNFDMYSATFDYFSFSNVVMETADAI